MSFIGKAVKGVVTSPFKTIGRLAKGDFGGALKSALPGLAVAAPFLLPALGAGGLAAKAGGLFGKLGSVLGGKGIGGLGGTLAQQLLGGGLGAAQILGQRSQNKQAQQFAQQQLDIQRRGLQQGEELFAQKAPIRQQSLAALGSALQRPASGIFRTSKERGRQAGFIG